MLKIYNAYCEYERIVLKDYIVFIRGQSDTRIQGFGHIKSSDIKIRRANYINMPLEQFLNYVISLQQSDGYVTDFTMYNPLNYEMLEEYVHIMQATGTSEHHDLDEEGVILFTNYVELNYQNNELIKKLLGRVTYNGMYLLKPNAIFSMRPSMLEEYNEYEVLQSNNSGRRLILSKMDRKI